MCVHLCDTRGWGEGDTHNNKGRGLAPRRPFIPFSRKVIPIDSYWTASREPLGGELCDLWRVARTRHAPPRAPTICSRNTTTPANSQTASFIFISLQSLLISDYMCTSPSSIDGQLLHRLLCHPSIYSSIISLSIFWIPPGVKRLVGPMAVEACSGYEAAIWLVRACVPRTGWMAAVGTSTSSPSHRTQDHCCSLRCGQCLGFVCWPRKDPGSDSRGRWWGCGASSVSVHWEHAEACCSCLCCCNECRPVQ